MKCINFNILVIGAGPAGLAAASSAAQYRASVGLIDDNPAAGGQIWRGGVHNVVPKQARSWFASIKASSITLLTGAKVIAPLEPGTLLVETPAETLLVHFERLILATGARELFLPFPGWTLPGIMGAGGLQALVKGGLPIAGKRVVVAGSGPLLLAVAAYLKGKGAHIQVIAEQTSWTKLGMFALYLTRHFSHIKQASELGWHLRGTPIRAGCWIKQAHGTDRLEAVTLCQNNRIWIETCDYLACGFGLVPQIELADVYGCDSVNGTVQVDEWQQTSHQGVYCAGEATGIGGLDLSLVEGQIAGLVAADRLDEARKHFPARKRARHFASVLQHTFALRSELKALADDDTLLCRCEDVTYHDIKQHASWRSAKLHTRCGMGPCQGRICGAATTFLFGWEQHAVRPPITAARLESFAQVDSGIMQ